MSGKLGNYIGNTIWWLGNKSIPYVTTTMGLGAAAGVDDGTPMALYAAKGAFELPAKLVADIITDRGILSDLARLCVDLADNVIEHPAETLGSIAGGVAVGGALKWWAENKRYRHKFSKYPR